MSRCGGIVLLIGALLTFDGAMAQAPVAPEPTLAPMLERVLPGVVSVAVRGRTVAPQNPLLSDPFFRRFFGLPEQQQPLEREFRAAGSGVIVDAARGFVLTNNHVVENADEITIALSDGRRLEADRIGTDPATDLAVLHIQATGLTAVPFGDSDRLRVGDYVVAIGNPFGLSQTATLGIVSALGRTNLGIGGYEDFIQTDASINPGNSGGALVNLKGELVGINSAIIGPSGGNVGIGFAIPINMARHIMEELIAHGEIRRGQLGVTIQDLTPELAKALKLTAARGVIVNSVAPGSVAQRAGIQAGDVITAVNGEAVSSASDLRNRIGMMRVGTRLRISLIRKGAAREVEAVLEEPKPSSRVAPADIPLLASVALGPVEPGSRSGGAVVLEVGPGSPAALAGLAAGDVIVGVNQEPVNSPEEVFAAARQDREQVLLEVMRNGSLRFILIS